jgi:hypothetical protein
MDNNLLDCSSDCAKDWSRAKKKYIPSKLSRASSKGASAPLNSLSVARASAPRAPLYIEDLYKNLENIEYNDDNDYITINTKDEESLSEDLVNEEYKNDIEYSEINFKEDKGARGAEALADEALATNIMIFTANNYNTNINNDFPYYVQKYMSDSEIYSKRSGCIYIKLERLGNFQYMYSKIYNFEDKLNSRIDYKYIYRKKTLKIIDNIFYLMEHNNIEFKFNLCDYDLYEVNNVSDLYIIKIKLKTAINNIINRKIESKKIESNNDSNSENENNNDSIDNSIDYSKIDDYEKSIKNIAKTMYIFHSYKKMFYYSLR